MQHLITTNDFTNEEILKLFNDAKLFLDLKTSKLLDGKLIVTLFFENSTRTRSSFEIAAKRLGAEVVNLEVQTSSTKKGESVEDTIANLNAMKPDAIIIRHSDCGLPNSLKSYVDCPILNAGDGKNAHPTQALLDLFTIMENFNYDVKGKNIAIIMSLRVQHERHTFDMSEVELEKSKQGYAKKYCITQKIMGDRNILLMHPGPVNRNIDISDEMLLDKRSKVLEQVRNGVAVRMACLKKLILKQ